MTNRPLLAATERVMKYIDVGPISAYQTENGIASRALFLDDVRTLATYAAEQLAAQSKYAEGVDRIVKFRRAYKNWCASVKNHNSYSHGDTHRLLTVLEMTGILFGDLPPTPAPKPNGE